MIEYLHHGAVDIAVNRGWPLMLLVWASFLLGSIFQLTRPALDGRVTRSGFLFLLLMGASIIQMNLATRAVGLAVLDSHAFVLHHYLYLATVGAFGALVTMAVRSRRANAGYPAGYDIPLALVPMAGLLLTFPGTGGANPGQRSSFRAKIWGAWLGSLVLLMSFTASAEILTLLPKAIDKQAVGRTIVESRIRVHGIDAMARDLAERIAASGTDVEIEGKDFTVSMAAELAKFEEGADWRQKQVAAFCSDPGLQAMVEEGYRITIRSLAPAAPAPVVVRKGDCP